MFIISKLVRFITFVTLLNIQLVSASEQNKDDQSGRVIAMRQAIVKDAQERYPRDERAGQAAGEYFDQKMGTNPTTSKVLEMDLKGVDRAIQGKK